MTDIALIQHDNGFFDIALNGVDLATHAGLESAIIISLYTDARASNDDLIPDGTDDRRGWWGGSFGSKLWLIDRAKATQETLNQAREYCHEALQWLIDDGVARVVDVTTEWLRDGVMIITVDITRPDGDRNTFKFADAWEAQLNEN